MADPLPEHVKSYRVRILYREPTYEMSIGQPKQTPYTYKVDLKAADPVAALRCALWEFESLQHSSGVGWVREVVRIEIDLASLAAAVPGQPK